MVDGDWIDWSGGERPVAMDALVVVRTRDNREYQGLACGMEWRYDRWGPGANIVAYRVVSVGASLGRLSALEARVTELEKAKEGASDDEVEPAWVWLCGPLNGGTRYATALREVQPKMAPLFRTWLSEAFNAGRKFEKESAK